ncbi:DUF1553 domain-containing protein [Pirellulaceae bacterium SH449]
MRKLESNSPLRKMPCLPLFNRSLFVLLTRVPYSIGFALTLTLGLVYGNDSQLEFFESRIRPILVEHCYACHNSLGQSDGGVVLDWRGGLLAGSDDGPIVEPGEPATSKLLAVIKHEIEGMEMPQGGAKLSATAIADIEKWIRDGLIDPRQSPPTKEEFESQTSWDATFARRLDWWSLQPIAPKLLSSQASLESDTRVLSNHLPSLIDYFIDQKLAETHIPKQNRANNHQLVRRLYQHLIGLPPSELELNAAVSEIDKAGSLEPLVDSLLARPEFGEKWARHWMDWLRYADSHGSEGDPAIDNAWYYRDYLIRALNNDVPYDQMLREHIAGDLIPDPRVDAELGFNESSIAMSHWRMVFHGFFPTDALDEKVRFLDDQINVFSKAFLGLTVSCARCHDHKFDPISQEDYYALYAALNQCRPARIVIDTSERQEMNVEKLQLLKREIREGLCDLWLGDKDRLVQRLLDPMEEPNKRKQPLLQTTGDSDSIDPDSIQRAWDLSKDDDTSDWIASGVGLPSTHDRKPMVSSSGEFRIAVEGDSILSEILPRGIYSGLISDKHSARLTSIDIRIEPGQYIWALVRGGGEATLRAVVQDYPRMGGIYPFLKPSNQWRWERLDMTYWEGDSAHFEIAHALDTAMPVSDRQRSWFGIREIALTTSTSPPRSKLGGTRGLTELLQVVKDSDDATKLADEILQAVMVWKNGTISDAQAIMLDELVTANILQNKASELTGKESQRILQLLTEYRSLEAAIPVPIRVPTIEEARKRKQQLYVRGDHKSPAQEVPPRFLSALNVTDPDNDFNRLRLVDEMLRRENPLTHRVIVNRIWHYLFGRGLVPTPDNFGRLGELPTHAELLDALVIAFRSQNTSLKSLIKQLVLSETWQADSVPTAEAAALDPDNRLWSHAMVRRLDAEGIRDSLLRVSGELSLQRFGPTVSGESNRRGLYVRVQRNSLDPFLRAFDFPEPFATVGRRDSTNVPAQSLALMNDPQITKLTTAWAKRLLESSEYADLSTRDRIAKMFVAALARNPEPIELDLIQRYRDESLQDLALQAAKAMEIVEAKSLVESKIAFLVGVARDKMLQQNNEDTISAPPVQPIVRFSFDSAALHSNRHDEEGAVRLDLQNGAQVIDGALVVDGKGFAISQPLPPSAMPRTLRQKTLEAWVQLDSFQQRGGGVISVQTRDGAGFDAIVFGEQTPGHWMAGSEFFARTKPFNGFVESDASQRMVHLAVVYEEDSTILAYRDGKPYGKSYRADGVRAFEPGDTILSLGVRHLPASNGKMLVGKIFEARLYDHALSPVEVESSYQSFHYGFQLSTVPQWLDEDQVTDWLRLQEQSRNLTILLQSLPLESSVDPELRVWSDIARSFFMMKEFLFIK